MKNIIKKERPEPEGYGGLSNTQKMHNTLIDMFESVEEANIWILSFTAGIYVLIILDALSEIIINII